MTLTLTLPPPVPAPLLYRPYVRSHVVCVQHG